MHPILFRIPLPHFWPFGLIGESLSIYSYGVMLGLSLVVGWYLTLGLSERNGLPKETMANCYVATAIAAVLGSRILYILTNLNEFDSLGSMFAMRRGGLVAYGGFLGGFLGSYLFLRRHRIPLLPWADVAVPSLASGLMITRIGCYLYGCDFGSPLSEKAPAWLKKLGTFPHWPEGTLEHGSGAPAWVQHVKERGLSPLSEHSLPVHPTQLYESLVGAALLILLLVAFRHQKFRGQIFLLFTFSYGVCRYMLEVLRDDAERGSLPLSLAEHILIPFGLLVFAIGYLIGFSKAIGNVALRRATQVLAFVPAVVMFVVLKPETFASTAPYQYSTSQFVGLATGFAAALAFSVYYKAALAHPESAMVIHLPDSSEPTTADEDADEDAADDEEGDEEPSKKSAKGAKEGGSKILTKAKKGAAAKVPAADEDEDGDEEPDEEAHRTPAKAKRSTARPKKQIAAVDDEGPEET